jgi:hypothetical protein
VSGQKKTRECFAGFKKWRRRWDLNPWNPYEVHFFSKEALSATQPLLHTNTDEESGLSAKINPYFQRI